MKKPVQTAVTPVVWPPRPIPEKITVTQFIHANTEIRPATVEMGIRIGENVIFADTTPEGIAKFREIQAAIETTIKQFVERHPEAPYER